MNRYCKTLAAVILTLLLAGCGGGGHDPRLERVAAMVSESPRESLAALGGIDTAGLSESDRAYFALLTVKAGDKAFIPHTTDTVVKSAVEYYSSHPDIGLTPEALYYGGRVYSDMGDYPKALDYFQRALDLLPEGTPDTNLRGNVLSQIGDHLIDLGLFEQTIPYIKESVKIDILNKDTVNRALDNCLMGVVYRYMEKYELADHYFRESLIDAEHLPEDIAAEIRVHQAANKYEKGATDSAMRLMRRAMGAVREDCRSMTLAYAAKIYLDANVLDTAYSYASTLAMDTTLDNRKTGYMVMLSPKLRDYIAVDSLDYYYADYKHVLEKHFFNRDKQGTLLQNSMYNYKVHDRDRMKAERKSESLTTALLLLSCVTLLLAVIIMYVRIRSRNRIIELQSAVRDLSELRRSLGFAGDPPSAGETPGSADSAATAAQDSEDMLFHGKPCITEDSLKAELKEQLSALCNTSAAQVPPPGLIDSSAFRSLRGYIDGGAVIPEKHTEFWRDLEAAVSECSPNFKRRLLFLTGGGLGVQDFRMALLIKCGVTPSQASTLLGRSKSTISYRRAELCARILGDKSELKELDKIIRLM